MTLITVDRALHLLQHIVHQGSLTVNQAAACVGTSRSSAQRLLSSLSSAGLIERDPDSGRFRPGDEFLRLAARVLATTDIRRAAADSMRTLAARWREAVTLCLRLSNNHALYFDRIPSPRRLQYVVPLGETARLHAGSSGRAILAYMQPEEIDDALSPPLEAYTPGTLTDPTAVRETLAEIRVQGYAISYSERIEDAVGVAAPIFDAHGKPVASLLISIPLVHLDDLPDLTIVGKAVREEADRVSLRLGWHHEDLSGSEYDSG